MNTRDDRTKLQLSGIQKSNKKKGEDPEFEKLKYMNMNVNVT